MNDSSNGPIIIALLFILRCLIPLGILFGLSYLLRRLELVIDHADEEKTKQAEEGQEQTPVETISPNQASPSKSIPGQKHQKGSKKPATPKKRSRNQ